MRDAAVARPVGKKDIASSPKAQESFRVEWTRLEDKGVWDQANPREWDDVRAEANRTGEPVHMGYMFDICVEKIQSSFPANEAIRGGWFFRATT